MGNTDWNGDGKTDMLDDAAAFQALHSAQGSRPVRQSGGCGSCILILFFTLLPWIITGLAMMESDNEMGEGGILFCLIGTFALEVGFIVLFARLHSGK